jgi:ATP-dependent helicase IRC3
LPPSFDTSGSRAQGSARRNLIRGLIRFRLSPAESTTVKCDLDLSHVELNAQGDFNASSLASRVNTSQVNDLIVRTYLHRAGMYCSCYPASLHDSQSPPAPIRETDSRIASRRSTLVFCVDLAHVAALTSAFRRAGIDARSVSSLSIPSVRRDTIAAFSNGQFPVLINCEVLTEGADIPEVS